MSRLRGRLQLVPKSSSSDEIDQRGNRTPRIAGSEDWWYPYLDDVVIWGRMWGFPEGKGKYRRNHF